MRVVFIHWAQEQRQREGVAGLFVDDEQRRSFAALLGQRVVAGQKIEIVLHRALDHALPLVGLPRREHPRCGFGDDLDARLHGRGGTAIRREIIHGNRTEALRLVPASLAGADLFVSGRIHDPAPGAEAVRVF